MEKNISVLMCVYNCEDYIEKSIKSIVNQTYKNFELIIINDGSTDSTVEKIKAFKDERIKIYDNDGNKGLPYSRDRALRLATGEYIAIMDADDIAAKKRFEYQVKFLENNKDIAVVASNMIEFSNRMIKRFRVYYEDYEKTKIFLMYKNCIPNSAAMIRKEFIDTNNIKYRKEYFVLQDYAFWADCSKYGKIAVLNRFLLFYRTEHNNITSRSKKEKMEQRNKLLDIIHERLLRQNGFVLEDEEINILNDGLREKNLFLEDDLINFNNILEKLKLINLEKSIFNINKFNEISNKIFLEVIKESKCSKKIKLKSIFTKSNEFKLKDKIIATIKIILK
ncbi:MAG: glycosyltransferase [Clostridium sp.]|nr:glycosyltransferase [Clostridium sp.]